MITYKNISFSAKTFYGVRFEPGEIKGVPGYINSRGMVRVFGYKPAAQPVSINELTLSKRGRKPKAAEPEKVEVAEITENLSEEETSNGNNS